MNAQADSLHLLNAPEENSIHDCFVFFSHLSQCSLLFERVDFDDTKIYTSRTLQLFSNIHDTCYLIANVRKTTKQHLDIVPKGSEKPAHLSDGRADVGLCC